LCPLGPEQLTSRSTIEPDRLERAFREERDHGGHLRLHRYGSVGTDVAAMVLDRKGKKRRPVEVDPHLVEASTSAARQAHEGVGQVNAQTQPPARGSSRRPNSTSRDRNTHRRYPCVLLACRSRTVRSATITSVASEPTCRGSSADSG
jgi:hypothetical protein